MTKIKTKVPVIVDIRDQKKAIISIEITNWAYNVGTGYTANVRDYIDKDLNPDYPTGGLYMGTDTLKTKSKTYPQENINALFTALGEGIAVSDNYTTKMNSLIGEALLYITKTELTDGKTIYGLLPEDWEVQI